MEVTITFSDNETLKFNCNKCNEITESTYYDENFDLGNCTTFPFLTCNNGHVFFFDDKHDPSENYLYDEKVTKKYNLLKIKGIWSDLSEDENFRLNLKDQLSFEENFKDTHIPESSSGSILSTGSGNIPNSSSLEQISHTKNGNISFLERKSRF